MQKFPGLFLRLPLAVIPGGIIGDWVCPGTSNAWKSVGAKLRVMATAWIRPRVTGRMRARIRTSALTRARATARTRTGARNRVRARASSKARARAKVTCSTGILSNAGTVDRLNAKSLIVYLVSKAGSSVGLPKKTFGGGVHEMARLRVWLLGLYR